MTIDERLDRLTERHEALAESLQPLTADIHELTEATKRNSADIGALLAISTMHHDSIPFAGRDGKRLEDSDKRG